MDHKLPAHIRYEYTHSVDKPEYTHGVWGGINPQGEIEMSFYLESDTMPHYSECSVSSEGQLGPEKSPLDEEVRSISRHIHSRVVLNYQTARAVLEWLEEKVEALEMEEGQMPLPLDKDYAQ